MKNFITITIITFATFFFTTTTQAADVNTINYPLQESEKIVFETIDEDGDLIITEIERVPSLMRVAKGTYKISKTKQGAWTASFNVSVDSGDKITGVNNMSVKALNGSIVSTNLSFNSKSATCTFTRKVGTTNINASLVASINNGKLVTN